MTQPTLRPVPRSMHAYFGFALMCRRVEHSFLRKFMVDKGERLGRWSILWNQQTLYGRNRN